MAILAECPRCRKKQKASNRLCACGENLVRARRSRRVRFWITYRMPGGSQRRESVGYSVSDARAADGKRRSQKKENRIFDIKPVAGMSFNELTSWYLNLGKVKRLAYYPTLKINLQRFNATFGDLIVGRIKPADLENYQVRRKADGLSDSYVDSHIASARAMIHKAFDNDLVSNDVVKIFQRVKKLLKGNTNARDRVLSGNEFTRLMRALPPHTRAIVATGYYGGMRKGEVLNLTWDQVDLRSRLIRLEASQTKDREPRKIPICDDLYGILKGVPKAIHDRHVFLFKSKPIKDIRTALKRGCRDAGINYGRGVRGGFVFHDTRHCFNTNMRRAGVSESVIMKITGHSTREMFLRYDSVDERDIRNAAVQMEEFLQGDHQDVDLTQQG